MRKPRFRSIATRIHSQIKKGEWDLLLPSIHELSRDYAASPVTIWKALHLLSKQGVIEIAQGKRSRVRGCASSRPQRLSSEDRFYEKLRGELLDGTVEWGNALPKLQYLAMKEHLAKGAVCHVLGRLAKENLIHKSGKQWVAGPSIRPADSGRVSRSSQGGPVVLIVTPFDVEARNFFALYHTAPFASSFRNELARFGFSFMLGTQYPSEVADMLFVGGLDEMRLLIHRLGDRYAGTLLVFSALAHEAELWVSDLGRFGKPVVVFDASNRVDPGLRSHVGLREKYYRLFLDEAIAVSVAVGHLLDSGHRRIATFDIDPQTPESFSTRRIDIIRETLHELDPSAVLVSAPQDDPIWEPQWERVEQWSVLDIIPKKINALRSSSSGGVRSRSALSLLRNESPRFLSVLRQDVSAILAVNDLAAIDYYLYLTALGVRMPGEISVLGFDNLPESQILPLSTIDFGFHQLGYLAAHIMIGDIPVKSDPQGNVPGKITLIEKGSVQRPPARSLAERLGL